MERKERWFPNDLLLRRMVYPRHWCHSHNMQVTEWLAGDGGCLLLNSSGILTWLRGYTALVKEYASQNQMSVRPLGRISRRSKKYQRIHTVFNRRLSNLVFVPKKCSGNALVFERLVPEYHARFLVLEQTSSVQYPNGLPLPGGHVLFISVFCEKSFVLPLTKRLLENRTTRTVHLPYVALSPYLLSMCC